jgi:phosphatidylserine decarboxylase
MWVLYFLPKKLLSYWVGKLMHLRLPKPLAQWSIKTFAEAYKINIQEAEKPLDQYSSIGDFFVRRLKPGLRPIAESPLVHPADSRIAQIGEIREGKCIQAKDRTYSVAELCGDFELAKKYQDGLFVTYYLCPTDYHRVHSPVDGSIEKLRHIPGHLWPVNEWSAQNIENLFAVNERVILEINSRVANCLLVFVGATNVGQIRVSFDSEIITNVTGDRDPVVKPYQPPVQIQRGQELGAFYMGSTVVMIYPKTIRLQRDDWQTFLGKQVQVNGAFL